MKKINKAIKVITKFENLIMVVAFVLMVVSYFISVVNRNIIKSSMAWTEELALYCMVYMALIGMELGLRDGTQVSVTALTSKLDKKAALIIDILSRIIVVIFTGAMFYYGFNLVSKQLQTGQTSPVMNIPMYAIYFSLVFSFGISFIVQSIILVCEILKVDTSPITGIDSKNNIEKEDRK